MSYAAMTHVGLRRAGNEDAHHASQGSNLFVVCDGLGGQDAGELAARITVQAIQNYMTRHGWLNRLDVDPERVASALRCAVDYAHEAVCSMSDALSLERSMATTVVACLILREVVVVAHVGDSRVYLMSDDGSFRLTEDHCVANMFRSYGAVDAAKLDRLPIARALTRAVGGSNRHDAETSVVPFRLGDRLLLCSDGLTGMVVDDDIRRLAVRDDDINTAALDLIHAALAGGGRDNVTVVLVDLAKSAAVTHDSTEPSEFRTH